MKKILVITPFFYPHIGGSEYYMENLYIRLRKKHPEILADVLCYNTDNAKEQEKYNGLTVYRVPCWNILPGKFAIPNPLILCRFLLIHQSEYNLIHTSTRFFDSSWWAPIFAKLIKKKIIITDHCAQTPQTTNPFINLCVLIIDQITSRIFLPFYDKIFAVSFATQSFLKKTLLVPSTVLYAGVDLASPVRKDNKRLNVVFAGRMIEEKGVNLLFNLAKQIKEVDFSFAGPGPLVEDLKKEIDKNNLSNINIFGKLDKKQLKELLSKTDIFVYPTNHTEGIPIALLEAGAYGLPVIASDIGGIKEVIENNKTGLLIKASSESELKEALSRLINDDQLRKKLGSNLYNHIKSNFDWDKSVEKFYSEIKNLF